MMCGDRGVTVLRSDNGGIEVRTRRSLGNVIRVEAKGFAADTHRKAGAGSVGNAELKDSGITRERGAQGFL